MQIYYPSAGCGMQELLPECRVWYAGAINRVQGVVCRSITRVQGVVCRSYYPSAGCGMQELLRECREWYAEAYPSAESGMQELTLVQGVVCRIHLCCSGMWSCRTRTPKLQCRVGDIKLK